MPLMARETGVTLGEIQEYTKKRYSTFSLLERTLRKTEKEYRETHKVKPITSASGALTDNQPPPNPEGEGHGRGKGPKKRRNRVLGASASHGNKDDGGQGRGTNGKKQEENKNPGGRTQKVAQCELCKIGNRRQAVPQDGRNLSWMPTQEARKRSPTSMSRMV